MAIKHKDNLQLSFGNKIRHVIDLFRISLQCVRTIEPEQSLDGHFHVSCILVHPELDSIPLFVGMQERPIRYITRQIFLVILELEQTRARNYTGA